MNCHPSLRKGTLHDALDEGRCLGGLLFVLRPEPNKRLHSIDSVMRFFPVEDVVRFLV